LDDTITKGELNNPRLLAKNGSDYLDLSSSVSYFSSTREIRSSSSSSMIKMIVILCTFDTRQA
jgi:hypothetical protein